MHRSLTDKAAVVTIGELGSNPSGAKFLCSSEAEWVTVNH